jgi:hypothetical protein
VKEIIASVGAAPADADIHRKLADAYAQRRQWVQAHAEYRSARALGGDPTTIDLRLAQCQSALAAGRPPDTNSHNLHFRTRWLARHLGGLFPSGNFSILDAGGGDGRLATLLPNADYVLAEPATNGVFVTSDLNFGRKFDCVVCCHVLEHIPENERDAFLDVLCGMASHYVLLLNPVVDPRIDLREWQQTIFEITGAKWAKEHIDCILPRLEDITGFAERRGYAHKVKPNGSKALALAVVFLDHYAKLGRPQDVARINQMLNAIALDHLDHADWPNAFLVEIQTRK